MPYTTSTATYKDAKGTRVYIAPLVADSPTTGWDGTEAGIATATWHLIGGVRSDREESQVSTTTVNHYGEAEGVSSTSPPTATMTLDISYAPDNTGQKIARWAQLNNKTIGVAVLYDGTNGWARTATVSAGGTGGEASGGIRSGNLTIAPIGTRLKIGTSDVWVPA